MKIKQFCSSSEDILVRYSNWPVEPFIVFGYSIIAGKDGRQHDNGTFLLSWPQSATH